MDCDRPFSLGLTTGRTPIGLYRELVERHKNGEVSFRNVTIYSLDEFYPIDPGAIQSRNFRIHEEFVNHIDILPENVHILDGMAVDPVAECEDYERRIREKGSPDSCHRHQEGESGCHGSGGCRE